MFGGFGGEFVSSETKMHWKLLRVPFAHGCLHHLLLVKGLFLFSSVCSLLTTMTNWNVKMKNTYFKNLDT